MVSEGRRQKGRPCPAAAWKGPPWPTCGVELGGFWRPGGGEGGRSAGLELDSPVPLGGSEPRLAQGEEGELFLSTSTWLDF